MGLHVRRQARQRGCLFRCQPILQPVPIPLPPRLANRVLCYGRLAFPRLRQHRARLFGWQRHGCLHCLQRLERFDCAVIGDTGRPPIQELLRLARRSSFPARHGQREETQIDNRIRRKLVPELLRVLAVLFGLLGYLHRLIERLDAGQPAHFLNGFLRGLGQRPAPHPAQHRPRSHFAHLLYRRDSRARRRAHPAEALLGRCKGRCPRRRWSGSRRAQAAHDVTPWQ